MLEAHHHGTYLGRQATEDRGLSRRILSQAGLHDVAENGFVNLMRIEAGAPDRFGDGFAAEFGCGESGEAALKFSDGRADGGQNDGSFRAHDKPPEEKRTLL